MRIAKVIGCVTLNRAHPSLAGGSLRLAVPLTLDNLRDGTEPTDIEPVVVYDQLGPGLGDLIALAEGREAAMPFYPDDKPLDAYNAAILDRIHLTK